MKKSRKKIIPTDDYFKKGLEIFIRRRIFSQKEIDIFKNDFQQYHKDISLFCIQKIGIFNSDVFVDWFTENINAWQTIPTGSQLDELLQDLLDTLEKSLDDCYVIIPLPFADIRKSIKMGEDCFIIAPHGKNNCFFRRNDYRTPQLIGKIISYVLGFDKKDTRISTYLADFQKYYSPFITKNPFLLIKQKDIFENIQYYSPALAMYARNCICLTLKSYKNDAPGILGQPIDYKEVKHIFIGSKNYVPMSLPMHIPQNHFKHGLNIFHDTPDSKEYFCNLLNIWNIDTKFAQEYRRAIHFFCWNVDEYAHPNGYLSIRIQMIFTGIETLLLAFSSSGEKKRKIAKIMAKLYQGRDYTSEEIETAVISLYNSRSMYIHAGDDQSYQYRPHLNDQGDFVAENNSLYIVDYVFSNILTMLPIQYKDWIESEKGFDKWKDFCKSTVVDGAMMIAP